MARSSWRVWTESITGKMLGVPISFDEHSHALAQVVKLYRDGDSGQTVRTFLCSDTGTKAREYRLKKTDTGDPNKEYGTNLGQIEGAQAKAFKARGGINEKSE